MSGIGLVAAVVRVVATDERGADRGAADEAQRLGREELAVGLDDREPRDLVAAIEREPREDLAAEIGRADAVAGEAEAVVHACRASRRSAGGWATRRSGRPRRA